MYSVLKKGLITQEKIELGVKRNIGILSFTDHFEAYQYGVRVFGNRGFDIVSLEVSEEDNAYCHELDDNYNSKHKLVKPVYITRISNYL